MCNRVVFPALSRPRNTSLPFFFHRPREGGRKEEGREEGREEGGGREGGRERRGKREQRVSS